MDCRDWENEISRREADLLDANQQKALDGHLAGCPMCRAVADRVKQGIQAMSSMPIVPAPKNFLDDSWRRIQKAAPPPPAGPLERFRRWLADVQGTLLVPVGVATAVILAVTVVPALRDGGGLQPRYKVLAQSGAVKVSPTPAGGAIIETSGGKVEVEHLGRAVYTLEGNGNRLQIGLGRPDNIELAAGGADVKVQADPAKPYAVEIGGAKVVVTGTMFHLQNGTPPSVKLTEGKIKLVGPDWSKELAPGDVVAWTEAGPVGDKPAIAPAAVPSAAASALAIPAPAPSAKPSAAAPKPAASPAKVGAVEARPAAVTASAPVASPIAPGPGASETEAGGNQLNDPFQGR